MVYDDETGRRVHLSLPLDDMRALADRMDNRPTRAEQDAIVRAVKRRAKGPDRPKVSPSWVRADLRHASIEVTVEQVAWVMVNVMKAPETTPRPRPRRRSRAFRWLIGNRD